MEHRNSKPGRRAIGGWQRDREVGAARSGGPFRPKRLSRPRVPAGVAPQRPVTALTAGAVLAVRPRSAVRVAPRLASVLVALLLGVLRVRARHVLQVAPHEVG